MKKKIILYFATIIICLSFDQCYAYTKIDSNEFKDKMEDAGYIISTVSNASIAYKTDENDMITEEYSFFSYANEEEAKNALYQFYEDSLEFPNIHFNSSDNYEKDTSSKEGYISYDFTMDGSVTHYYYYIYRVDNIIVMGSSDISKEETIKEVISTLLTDPSESDDDEKKSEEILEETNNKISFRDIILSGIGTLCFIVGGILFILSLKKIKKQ